mgnify:CR=1 FL=1
MNSIIAFLYRCLSTEKSLKNAKVDAYTEVMLGRWIYLYIDGFVLDPQRPAPMASWPDSSNSASPQGNVIVEIRVNQRYKKYDEQILVLSSPEYKSAA